jgi:hypothetical protein
VELRSGLRRIKILANELWNHLYLLIYLALTDGRLFHVEFARGISYVVKLSNQ